MSKRNGRGVITALTAALGLTVVHSAPGATYLWDGGGANNNLETDANWNPDGAPDRTGGHDLQFAGSTRTNANISSGDWTVNSITVNSGAGLFTLNNSSTYKFIIGAGGVVNNASYALIIATPIQLSANQTWNAAASGDIRANNASTSETLDLNGFTLTLTSASSTPQFQIYNPMVGGGVIEKSGTCTANLRASYAGGGEVRLNAGTLAIFNQAALSSKLTWYNSSDTYLMLGGSTAVNWTLTNAVVLIDNGSGSFGCSQGTPSSGDHNMTFTGPWSGAIQTGGGINTELLRFYLGTSSSILRLQGDNSGLTSGKTAINGENQVVWLRRGWLILDHPNALGTGNSLSIGLGNYGDAATCRLLATSGNHVSAVIGTGYRPGSPGTGPGTGSISIGLDGTGTVSFTGNIINNVNNETTLRNVVLRGGSGMATFSGLIADRGGAAPFPIIISSGTVRLTYGNRYAGGTTVYTNSTLLADGSVSASAASKSGTRVNGSPLITNIDTSGLAIGQSLSGSGIPANAYILAMTSTSITMNVNATSGGTSTYNFDAYEGYATGTNTVTVNEGGRLGGSGRIRGATTLNGAFYFDPAVVTGKLTIVSTLTLGAGSGLEIEGTLSPATEYVLVEAAGGVNGTFATVKLNGVVQPSPTAPGGIGKTHQLVYNANDIRLAASPAPKGTVMIIR